MTYFSQLFSLFENKKRKQINEGGSVPLRISPQEKKDEVNFNGNGSKDDFHSDHEHQVNIMSQTQDTGEGDRRAKSQKLS